MIRFHFIGAPKTWDKSDVKVVETLVINYDSKTKSLNASSREKIQTKTIYVQTQ